MLPPRGPVWLFAALTAIRLPEKGRTEDAETDCGGGSVRLMFHRGPVWWTERSANVVRNMYAVDEWLFYVELIAKRCLGRLAR